MYNLIEYEVRFMEYQIIGKITGFKGLKGQLKVKALSGFMKERLQADTKIYMDIFGTYQGFTVKEYHENQKIPLLTLKGYEDINRVQAFKGKAFYVDADEDFLMEDDAYHEDELIGLKVYQNDHLIGVVVDIRNYPKDDYLVIEKDEKTYLLPFRDEFIISMDDQIIHVIDMEGLF